MANQFSGTIEELFWEKVDRSSECWVWNGTRDKWGYGGVQVKQKRMLAHRLSYELNYGPIPEGMNVLHRCDNPPCVRPDHLFLGTHLDNMRDCQAKGRFNLIRRWKHSQDCMDAWYQRGSGCICGQEGK